MKSLNKALQAKVGTQQHFTAVDCLAEPESSGCSKRPVGS